MESRAKAGDIFAMKIPNGQFIFGRIMLDLEEQCRKPGLIEPGSSLWLGECYLIQVFELVADTPVYRHSDVAINGMIVDDYAFLEDIWKVVDHKKKSPSEIDFNEYLFPDGDFLSIVKGEVRIKTSLPRDKYYIYMITGGIEPSMYLDRQVLPYLGKASLVKPL